MIPIALLIQRFTPDINVLLKEAGATQPTPQMFNGIQKIPRNYPIDE